MPGPMTIKSGQTAPKLAKAVLNYVLDYDGLNLAQGVELASVGTFTVTPHGLLIDETDLQNGNRKVDFRIAGGAPGIVYTVEHVAATNEVPPATKASRFYVRVT